MTSDSPRMTMCCFLDGDSSHPPDSTGMNKVGYITSDDNVVFPFRKRFRLRSSPKVEGRNFGTVPDGNLRGSHETD